MQLYRKVFNSGTATIINISGVLQFEPMSLVLNVMPNCISNKIFWHPLFFYLPKFFASQSENKEGLYQLTISFDIYFMTSFSQALKVATIVDFMQWIDRKNTKAMAHTTSPNEVGGVVRVLPFAKKEPFLIDRTLPSTYSTSRSAATLCAQITLSLF